MVSASEHNDLHLSGEHHIDVPRERLWKSLNDPGVLQACIKGCQSVVRVSENEFEAEFRFRVGPVKKSFRAQLKVADADSPEKYRLVSHMDAGAAGEVQGVADVSLDSIGCDKTRLRYRSKINAAGWLGRLGLRVLGSTAERYMNRFFDRIADEIQKQGCA